MSTQSMVRAVITGRLLLSNGTVYGCGRLGINRHQSVTYSLSGEVLVESSV
jgi:hypothetical protein